MIYRDVKYICFGVSSPYRPLNPHLLDEVINERIPDNYQCLACNYVFNQKTD